MKTYLKGILESQNSRYKEKYLEIVTFYKENPISKSEYGEIHHITPQWYYRHNELPIDNRKSNKVRLPFRKHLECHILLFKHFKFINDLPNSYKAASACLMLLNQYNTTKSNKLDKIERLNEILEDGDDIYSVIENLKETHLDACKKWCKENPLWNGTITPVKTLSPEKYEEYRAKLRIATGGENNPRFKWTKEKIIEIRDYYNEHGFEKTNEHFNLNYKKFLYLKQMFLRAGITFNIKLYNKKTNESITWEYGKPKPSNEWTTYTPEFREKLGKSLVIKNKRRTLNRKEQFELIKPYYDIVNEWKLKYKNKKFKNKILKENLKKAGWTNTLGSLYHKIARYVIPFLEENNVG